MNRHRIRRLILPLLPGLLAAATANAGSFIDFETVGPNASTDAQVLADQLRPTQGIRFRRADGSGVPLAKTGTPSTAFAAGTDTETWTDGDALPTTDPWAAAVGGTFLGLAGTETLALVIDYDYATSSAGGLLLDVDPDETWVIRAYSDAGTTLVAETVLSGGSPGTGDRVATPWAVVRPSADIVELRIVQTGPNVHAGAALDLFSPYGPLTFQSDELALNLTGGTPPAVGLQVTATPGHRLLLETSDTLESGSWTLDQALTPLAPITALTGTAGGDGSRRYFRVVGPSPETDRATSIYSAVNAFVNTLSAAQVTTVIFPASNTAQRSKWSNFPTGIYQRNGLKIGAMSAAQIQALYSMLAAVLSPEGFQKVSRIMTGDQQLGGGNYGTNEYYVSFVGTPSPTSKYLLQFGGHHLALNVTIQGAQATIAPALPGVQPGSYTYNGRTVRPIGDEYDLSFALLNSMTAEQRSATVLSGTVSDLALGPGKDGVTVLPEGIQASELSEAQRAILLNLIGKYVNIIHDDASAAKMESIRAHIADSDNATYFSWRGPTTAGSAAYFRIQGPNLFIEWAPQTLGGSAVNHTHAMYRELANDYGALITE